MRHLTLRAKSDSRFLARIVDREGFVFVLDYGDPAVIADATDRIHRGFSMVIDGRPLHVGPGSPDLLERLQQHYAASEMHTSLQNGRSTRPCAPVPSLDEGEIAASASPAIGSTHAAPNERA